MKKNVNLPRWSISIFYIIGVCCFIGIPMLSNYLIMKTTKSDTDISFTLLDYINLTPPVVFIFVLIIPVIILDRVQSSKIDTDNIKQIAKSNLQYTRSGSVLYSVGLNFDRFALRDIGLGILFAIFTLGAIFVHSNFLLGEKLWTNNVDITNFNFIATTFFLVLTEELLFRGYIFQNIYRKNNSILVVLVSSLLFALAHFISYDFDIIYFLNIFIAGILFCVMYIKTKSLWGSISFHFAWNVLSFNTSIEHNFLCGIALLIFIFIVLKFFKPSYRINSYWLVN